MIFRSTLFAIAATFSSSALAAEKGSSENWDYAAETEALSVEATWLLGARKTDRPDRLGEAKILEALDALFDDAFAAGDLDTETHRVFDGLASGDLSVSDIDVNDLSIPMWAGCGAGILFVLAGAAHGNALAVMAGALTIDAYCGA